MSLRLRLSACLLSLSLFAGCGSGGSNVVSALAQLQACMGVGVIELYSLALRFAIFEQVLAGAEAPPGYDVTATPAPSPPAAPFAYDFSFSLDLNSDMVADQTYAGTAVFSDDPEDGLEPDATVTLDFTRTSASGPTSSGSRDITHNGSGQLILSGTFSNTANGCTVNLNMDLASPLIALVPLEDEGPMVEGIFPIGFSGSVAAAANGFGSLLEALLQFAPGSSGVGVTNFSLDDVPLPDEFLDLFLSTEDLFLAIECANSFTGILFEGVLETLSDVLEAVSNGETTIPNGSFSLIPTGGNNFNYTIQLDVEGETITFTGTITLNPIPTSAAYTGTATLTTSVAISDDSFTVTSIAGQPMVIAFVDGEVVSFYGGLTITDNETNCTGTLVIPASNPVKLDQDTLGIMTLTFDVDGVDVVLVNHFPPGGARPLVASATINGVAIPPDLFALITLDR